ncbi:hypothetical protein EI555_005537, partial [Monodon monoceros]
PEAQYHSVEPSLEKLERARGAPSTLPRSGRVVEPTSRIFGLGLRHYPARLLAPPRPQGPMSTNVHGVEAEEAVSEQCVSVEQVTEDRNPKLEPSILKPLSSDMSVLVEKDVLYLADNMFTCREVEKAFLGSLGFPQHQPSHDGEHPRRSRQRREVSHPGQEHHKCSECGKAFSKKFKFAEHLRVHTGEKPYECSDCGKFFRHSSSLIHHRKVHTGERPYECCNCEKVFAHKYKLFEHQRIHTGKRPYESPKNPHKKILISVVNVESASCTKITFLCTRGSTVEKGLMGAANVESPLSSKKGFFITSESTLQKGLTCAVNVGKPVSTKEVLLRYECSECGKALNGKVKLAEHQRIHTGERPYKCNECEKAFMRKYTLVQHQKVHTGVKPFKCSECGKPFTYKTSLAVHQRIHTRERPYMCSE